MTMTGRRWRVMYKSDEDEYKKIISLERELFSAILEEQISVRKSLVDKNYDKLIKSLNDMGKSLDEISRLERARESISLSEKDAQIRELERNVRNMAVKFGVENRAIGEFAKSSSEFAKEALDEISIRRRSKLYNDKGIARGKADSLMIDTMR